MRRRVTAFAAAAAVLLADRVTKEMVQARIGLTEAVPVVPGVFNIVHTTNRGAIFGVLAGAEGVWSTVFLTILSAVVLVFVARLLWQLTSPGAHGNRLLRASLALILGGALGNLYDRLAQGSVTDFLQVFIGSYEWPSFNVADSAISTGAALLLLDLVRGHRKAERA